MSSLHREEIGFSVKASGVAGEAAVPAYDAVAGDDEGDGISSDGASDGVGKSLRDVSVGHRFSVGDLGEDLPYGKAKRSADEMEGRRGLRLFSRKVQS